MVKPQTPLKETVKETGHQQFGEQFHIEMKQTNYRVGSRGVVNTSYSTVNQSIGQSMRDYRMMPKLVSTFVRSKYVSSIHTYMLPAGTPADMFHSITAAMLRRTEQ